MRFYATVTATTASAGAQTPAAAVTDPTRVWFSPLDRFADFAVTAGTAYFAYVGYLPANSVFGFTEAMLTSIVNVGTPPGELEMAVLKSVDAPSGLGTQALTVLATSTVLDPVITTAVNLMHANQDPYNVTLATAAHCWTGFRWTANAVISQRPEWIGLVHDFQEGWVKLIASCPALTSTGTFFAYTQTAIPAVVSDAIAPDWRLRLV